MIGKPVKRQYTICNAMEESFKKSLLEMAKGEKITDDARLAETLSDKD